MSITVASLNAADRDDLAHLLVSYQTWLAENTDEITEVARLGAEARRLRETDWHPQGYYLARRPDGVAIGCIAVDCNGHVAKITRFHVSRPGDGIGRSLLNYVLQVAISKHIRCVELDTSVRMIAARHLYLSLGFKDVTREHDTPEMGVIYFRKVLQQPSDYPPC